MLRRSGRTILVTVLCGLIFGGGLGAGAASTLFPVYLQQLDPISGDLTLPLITHQAFIGVAAIGFAGGLSLAIGRGDGIGRIFRTAVGGLAGALLGAIIFQLFGAFLLSQSKTEMPIAADTIARGLSLALTCISTAAGAVLVDRLARRRSSRSQDPLPENCQPLTS